MHPLDATVDSNLNISGGGVLSLPTTRKRTKSYLALAIEPTGDPSTITTSSETGNPTISSNSPTFSALSNLQNPPNSATPMLSNEPASSRARTPNLSNLPTNGPIRIGSRVFGSSSKWRLGNAILENTLDWVVVLVAVIALAASEKAKPREAYIPKTLLSFTNYPAIDNSVPPWSVPVYSLVVPAICFVLHSVIFRRPLIEANQLVLGVACSVLVTGALTNMIKCPVGRLRPDFNARCWPDGNMQWLKEDPLGGYAKCTGDEGRVREGRKSFPSGHSSWSASGLCFVTWFLLDRLQAFDGSGHSWRLLVASLPAMAAVSVGITRYTDNWHHPTDIAAGLLLGCLISWLFYWQQRYKLAELDPVVYGGVLGSGTRSTVSGGTAARFSDDDGVALLPRQELPV